MISSTFYMCIYNCPISFICCQTYLKKNIFASSSFSFIPLTLHNFGSAVNTASESNHQFCGLILVSFSLISLEFDIVDHSWKIFTCLERPLFSWGNPLYLIIPLSFVIFCIFWDILILIGLYLLSSNWILLNIYL